MWRKWLGKDVDTHRLLVSFWSSLGFVGLGASSLVFGPTLLDLGESIGVGVAVMSAMFGARASGAAVGSIGLGYIMDKWSQFSYTIITLVLAACIITTVIVPVSTSVYVLALFMLCNGVAMGAQDSATHALLMKLWKDNSGPCMQVLHFTFAFGAFIAPLIAKDFISEDTPDINHDITINHTHFTAATPIFDIETLMPNNHTLQDEDHSTRFKLAYWVASATYLPTLAAFLYFAAKYDFLEGKNATVVEVPSEESSDMKNQGGVRYSKKKMDIKSDVVTEETASEAPLGDAPLASDAESSSEKEEIIFVKNSSNGTAKLSQNDIEKSILSTKAALLTRYRYTILLLLAAFMFMYVGMEVAYGSLIFTATVLGSLKFSKHQASLIQAVFWGLFTFGRLFSIILVFFRVRSSIMISMNLTGSLVASVIMVAFIHNAPAIWIASVVLGASYSSIFPTAMTWMSETVEPTGVATAILIAGGILGNIVLSALVGVSIAAVSPDMLFYLTFVGVVISGAIACGMFWTARMNRRSDVQSSPIKTKTLQVSNSSSKEEKVKLMEVRDQSDEEEEEESQLI